MLRRMIGTIVALLLVLLLVPGQALAARPGNGGGGGGGGTTWNYTALGDSLGTGFGAAKGYVTRYSEYLAADNSVSVKLTNTSVNGWTSADLLGAIKTDRKMRNSVKGSHVVTWNIGGNDLRDARTKYKQGTCGGSDNQDCLRATVAAVTGNWDQIVEEIKALRGTATTLLRTMDIYNPYVSTDMADGSFYVFKQYLDEVNQHIAARAAHYGYEFAPVYVAFNGADGTEDPIAKGYIWIDGLHPNDTGHQVIAQLLRSLGYSPLR